MAGRFTSKAVANWLLARFLEDQRPCTQLQMNKLVYIFHGWHLAVDAQGDGLISERILAWKYGPIVPSLRDEFRDFGADPITRFADEWIGDGELYTPTLEGEGPLEWEADLLEWAYQGYGRLSGPQLIELTHRPDSPWSTTTKNGRDIGFNKPISNDLIREHYRGLLERQRAKIEQ